jgi:uncharacterized protein YbjT (DUF2867 family)
MRILVIGGSGLIGSKLVERLRGHGHEVVAASPASGVNTLTGEGLAPACAGTHTVVDVSNSPSFEAAAVLEFFTTSTRNQLAAEVEAGVAHHAALSVVGTDRLAESGYFRAKIAQEELIRESGIPFSILHATQFFEFLGRMADGATEGDTVRVAPVLIQPMAAEDVADRLCDVVLAPPLNGMVEVGGPEQVRFDDLMRDVLQDANDPRQVVADPDARYFGAALGQRTLVCDDDARLTSTPLKEWSSAARSRG